MRQKLWASGMGMLLISATFVIAATAGSVPAVSPSAKDKCPVCGMFVAKYPDWVAQIHFKNHKTVFFDGAKDLFKYTFRLNHYNPGRSPDEIAAIYVTAYYTVTSIDAVEAFFVVGSDVYGPMGRELIPFSSAQKAEEFMRDHHGSQILRFKEVSPELLQTLD